MNFATKNRGELTKDELAFIMDLPLVPLLTDEEEVMLLKRYQDGDEEALGRFVEALFRLMMEKRLGKEIADDGRSLKERLAELTSEDKAYIIGLRGIPRPSAEEDASLLHRILDDADKEAKIRFVEAHFSHVLEEWKTQFDKEE